MTTTATAATGTTTWAIDPAHTHVGFAVKHLMISTVRGRFGGVTGSVVTDEADPARGIAEIEIDAASIDTREGQRDAHLKSADFFDVEKFPKLIFKSKRIADAKGDTFKLIGDLTIHGVTREVTLDVTSGGRGKDPWGGERAAFSATTAIKRSDYGLTWNQALEAGGFLVGDEVKISLNIQAIGE